MGFLRPGTRFAATTMIAACTLLPLSACQKAQTRGHAAGADSLRVVLERVEKQREQLHQQNESLQALTGQLEEGNRHLQSELQHTRAVLEYVERQFVSLEQGLQSYETKASAVAALAEARLAYDKLIREDPDAKKRPAVVEALEKLQKSDEMIPKQRYAASVYFAKRALRLLEEHSKGGNVRIVTVNNANMREGPGLDFNVISRMTLGTVLIELEHQSQWYRVETEAGLSGWVHESVTALR
jgi:DNA repair exonuclease SbcCD ATPase subunit